MIDITLSRLERELMASPEGPLWGLWRAEHLRVVEPRLCYLDGAWAYFTTQKLSDQWGDDWNDAPYQHNAGPPYEWGPHDAKAGKKPWVIVKLAFATNLLQPCDPGGGMLRVWSVEDINNFKAPWLRPYPGDYGQPVMAGATFSEFKRALAEAGGEVYERTV